MSKFVAHVQNKIYCELEFDDVNMKPSPNLIAHIYIHDGFGITLPTLTLFMQDPAGSLQNDMNLVSGLKCSITLAKDGAKDRRKKRDFRLWSLSREITGDGPTIKAVFVLDAPKFGTSVYCEAYRDTSTGAMSKIAHACGLKYEGPESGTDDNMTWLNIHNTRANWSEDIALRGYASSSSAMVRMVTMEGVLKYKDMFEIMEREPDVAFLKDSVGTSGARLKYAVRETKELDGSGVVNQWVNYGQKQYVQTLNNPEPSLIDGYDAPVLGAALPVYEKVRSELDAPARVTYAGFDTGTDPKPDANLHKNYEQALYQNVRGMGLFSNRLRILVDEYTEAESLTCAEYDQLDASGMSTASSKALNGKYVVVGHTLSIKNGVNFSEIFDLVRPYVTPPAAKAGTSAAAGGTAASANAKDDLVSERVAELESRQVQPPQAQSAKQKDFVPEIDQLDKLIDSLIEFDKAVPMIPSAPLTEAGTLGPTSAPIVAQSNLAASLSQIQGSGSELSRVISSSVEGLSLTNAVTIKKVGASAVEHSANTAIALVESNTDVGLRGLPVEQLNDIGVGLEKSVTDRFVLDTGRDSLKAVKDEQFKALISPISAQQIPLNEFITDPLTGGIFEQDFADHSLPLPELDTPIVDAVKQHSSFGTNFVFSAQHFGLSTEDILLRPSTVVEYAERVVDQYKEPERVLRDQGADVYYDKFGHRMPNDAEDAVRRVADKLPGLKDRYNVNEVLAGDANKTAQQSGFVLVGSVLKLGKTVGLDPTLEVDNWRITNKVVDGVMGVKNDTGFSKVFNFRFGQTGVGPLVERAVRKERIDTHTAVETITTVRDTVSWQNFTQMGSNTAKQEQQDKHWAYPQDRAISTFATGVGDSYSFIGLE